MTENNNTSLLKVEIVSSQGKLFSGDCTLLSVSTTEGELGIVHGHTPLLAFLKPGEVRMGHATEATEYIYVSGGILEVQPFLVSILADTAIRAKNLDEAAAKQARAKAETLMKTATSRIDYAAAKAELMQSLAILRTIEDARLQRQKLKHPIA